MKPPSFEAILGALAVLAAGAGCNKNDAAAPAPEAAEQTGSPNAAASAAAPPALATPAATVTAEAKPSDVAVDAGHETTSGAARKRAPAVACGAAGCSPDMKKNR